MTASFPEAPSGGFKDTDHGRVGGGEALDGCTDAKLVSVARG